jgi:hypothetical protein
MTEHVPLAVNSAQVTSTDHSQEQVSTFFANYSRLKELMRGYRVCMSRCVFTTAQACRMVLSRPTLFRLAVDMIGQTRDKMTAPSDSYQVVQTHMSYRAGDISRIGIVLGRPWWKIIRRIRWIARV